MELSKGRDYDEMPLFSRPNKSHLKGSGEIVFNALEAAGFDPKICSFGEANYEIVIQLEEETEH